MIDTTNSGNEQSRLRGTRKDFLRKALLGVVGVVAAGASVKWLGSFKGKKPGFGDIPPEGAIFEPRKDQKEAWLKKRRQGRL